ncbi:MAG: Tagatose-6-phosphate kinase [Chloroflexi bacterium ADurb.Bin325]|nr:MAG: Tagatose-6-phosphate kinase [Chloroflexi bacterium ADurb.Bin325]
MSQANRVVTVTINPAIDQTISIPNFTAGAVNRVRESQMHAGGKGINVAAFLADFGEHATATGILGRANDELFRRLFSEKGIVDRCVRIAGATRIGVKIADTALRQTTDINFPGQTPEPADIARLFAILGELATEHEWFVLSGSIPAGVSAEIYAQMIRLLAGAPAGRAPKVVLDTSGEALRQAVLAGPWLIKPNIDELAELVAERPATAADIVRVARVLMQRHGIASVVVSMGKAGAVFIEGVEAIWATPPAVEVQSTVGAGDAMVAGIVAGKLAGLPLAECARLATAFSVAAIGRIGSGLPSLAAVEAARARVAIRPISDG